MKYVKILLPIAAFSCGALFAAQTNAVSADPYASSAKASKPADTKKLLTPVGGEFGKPAKPQEQIVGFSSKESLPKKFDWHVILLNQIGFDSAMPKRFTAPISQNGADFYVRALDDEKPLFKGKVVNGMGDFSAFVPPEGSDDNREYVIVIDGDADLKSGVSDPFKVMPDFYKKMFWQRAVDFLIDSRSVIGTHPSAYGGCPWRDGTYYDFIVPSLVLFYLSDPAMVESMPRQIDYDAEKKRVLDEKFGYVQINPQGGTLEILKVARDYFNKITPPAKDAPDVVKMIHWGLAFYTLNPSTKDPARDDLPRRIHSQTLEQMVYALWAWPKLSKWIDKSLYDAALKVVFDNWKESGALDVDPYWAEDSYNSYMQSFSCQHPIKGRHAAGHSIVPNLLMYELAKREGKPNPQQYLDAAVKQADWIVKNLNWDNPYTTKGQRMSEHRTIPNLVWLLKKYPDKAPEGLKEKIASWVVDTQRKSFNMWDFRVFDPYRGMYTIPSMNEVGNLLSFPACAVAAMWTLDDKASKDRLEEIMVAQTDAIFGRNPRMCAGVSYADQWEGVDRAWPRLYKHDICARLEKCRSTVATACGSESYPFQPNAPYRHAEGWVNYGASWCVSLAYLNWLKEGVSPDMIKMD